MLANDLGGGIETPRTTLPGQSDLEPSYNGTGEYEPFPSTATGGGGGYVPPVTPNPTFVPPSYLPKGSVKIHLISNETVQFTENDISVGNGLSITLDKPVVSFGDQKIYKSVLNGKRTLNYFIVSIQKNFNSDTDIINNQSTLLPGTSDIITPNTSKAVVSSQNTYNPVISYGFNSTTSVNDYIFSEIVSIKEFELDVNTGQYSFLNERKLASTSGFIDLNFRFEERSIVTPPTNTNSTIGYQIGFKSNYANELGDKVILKYDIVDINKNIISSDSISLSTGESDTKYIETAQLKDITINFTIDAQIPNEYKYNASYYINSSALTTIKSVGFSNWKQVGQSFSISGNDLQSGIVVDVEFDKDAQPVVKPTVVLDKTQYEVRVKESDDDTLFNLQFTALNCDYVDVYISSEKAYRVPYNKGYVQLSFKNDFASKFGNKELLFVANSSKYGAGDRVKAIINYVSVNDFPDMTQIIFPANVNVPAFSDLIVEWDVTYKSFSASSVDVYLLAKDLTRLPLFSNLTPNGTFKINLADLASRFSTWNGSDKLTLIFKPYNRASETEHEGNEHEVTTNIIYPSIKLDETIIRKSIYDAFINKLQFTEPEKESKYLTHLLNLGNDEHILISSWEEDNWTLSDKTEDELGNQIVTKEVKSLILKLYSPLPPEIQANQTFWISKLMTNPLIETIVLNEQFEEVHPIIKGPNFNIDVDFVMGTSIESESLDDLIISASSSTNLIQTYLSGSNIGLEDLNIQYYSGSLSGSYEYLWDNFVHFSSAVERVNNFVYKVQLIQNYEGLIDSASIGAQTASLAGQQEIQRLNAKKSSLIHGFDGFESFLYNGTIETANQTSQSISWPGFRYKELQSLNIIDITNDDPAAITINNTTTLKTGDYVYIDGVGGMTELNGNYYYVEVTGNYILLYTKIIGTSAGDGSVTLDANGFGSYTSGGNVYKVTNRIGLLPSTSKTVVDWYDTLIGLATLYDNENPNYLVNNIPQYILINPENSNFLLFFSMIGHHFDTIYFYTKALERSRNLGYSSKNNVADRLLYDQLKSMSWDALNLGQDHKLWDYMFGEDSDGNTIQSNPSKNRTSEVWRRIINNLPYLLKHKGSRRGIHALMACYGIPSSNLSIMEFGGPEVTEDSKAKLLVDNVSYGLTMSSGNSISVVNSNIKSIELFIKPKTAGNYNVALNNSVNLIISGAIDSEYGKVKFGSLETPLLPLFNGRYFGISLANWTSYRELNVVQTDGDRLIFSSSIQGSQAMSSTNVTIGSTFQGVIDEFRIWNTPLSRSIFEQHVYYPEMVNGNHISASTTDLEVRFDFEYPKNVAAKTKIFNVAPGINLGTHNRNYYEDNDTTTGISGKSTLSGTASGFSGTSTFPYQFEKIDRNCVLEIPDLGASRYSTNKVRFEEQTLVSDLSAKHRSTKKAFDHSPSDSNRVGIFVSPNKELNFDIAKSIGASNLDDYIGDPSDRYNPTYNSLDKLRNYYFQRVHNRDIYEYINIIKSYEKVMFDDIKKMLPARVKATTGLLIEPHFLERSKYTYTKPEGDDFYYEGETQHTASIYGQNNQFDALIDANLSENLFGENEQYESIINVNLSENIFCENEQYESIIYANDEINLSGDYKNYETIVNAKYELPTVTSQTDVEASNTLLANTLLQDVGFSVYCQNGSAIWSYYDATGALIKERILVNLVTEQKTKTFDKYIVVNNGIGDSRGGFVTTSSYYQETNLVIQEFTSSAVPTPPSVGGTILNVTPVNGYLPTHYKYVGDLTTGMKNSYYNGSKNTIDTTLDGTNPVEVFVTNPNTIKKVGNRDNNEPIIEVE